MPKRRNWDQAAAAIWPALTSAAEKRQTLTYGELAPLIPTNPLSVGRALGPIQTYCLEANLPPLTVVVISKASGQPGNGFVAWDLDDLDEGLEAVFRYPWNSVENPFEGFASGETEAGFVKSLIDAPESADHVYGKIRNRGVAQRIFRRAVLESYDYECCMCGLSFESALEAAHITPWGESTRQERLDVRNGLLLCSTHHRMYDAGEMNLTSSYKIQYYDPEGEEGNYSAVDTALTLQLHGSQARLPENKALWPDKTALRRRLQSQE